MTGKLFYLDPGAKSINVVNTDGSNQQTLVHNRKHVPDGIVVDTKHRHIYWTEMGEMEGDKDDGSIHRANLDGSDVTTIVPVGGTHTPKQLAISTGSERLWWCDREGMRIQSCSLDGTALQTLIDRRPQGTAFAAATKDERNHCVGIAVDERSNHIYWTQKGPPKGNQGRIFRRFLSSSGSEGGDVTLLFDNLPEPIDLELVEVDGAKFLYWTDRGAAPAGNTLNRCTLGQDGDPVGDVQVLVGGFHETIGVTVVTQGPDAGYLYVTDLAGSIYRTNLDGSAKKVILAGGKGDQLTGIWYADV